MPREYLEYGKVDAPPLDFIIDIGLNNGESMESYEAVEWFKSSIKIGFECNPRWLHILKPHAKEKDYVLYDRCAWTENTTLSLFIDEHFDDSAGTSLLKDHSRAQVGKTRQVPTLDFTAYIGDLVREKDRVFVKMDIEGAEFKVVREMILRPAPEDSLDDPSLGSMPTLCLLDQFALEEHYEDKLRPPSLRKRLRDDETVDQDGNAIKHPRKIDSRLKDIVEYIGAARFYEDGEEDEEKKPEPEPEEEEEGGGKIEEEIVEEKLPKARTDDGDEVVDQEPEAKPPPKVKAVDTKARPAVKVNSAAAKVVKAQAKGQKAGAGQKAAGKKIAARKKSSRKEKRAPKGGDREKRVEKRTRPRCEIKYMDWF